MLDELGVAHAVRQRGARLTGFEVRAGGGTLLREITVPDARFVAIHRADLHAALRTAVPADRVRACTDGAQTSRIDAASGAQRVR